MVRERKPYDPKYWDKPNAAERERSTSWEEYWRAGYQVDQKTPVMVKEYCRTEEEAWKVSTSSAVEVATALDKVELEADVVPWIQHWRTHTTTHTQTRDEQTMDAVPRYVSERERGFIKLEHVRDIEAKS